jgi:tetratricopeptide (TPR) repeat protein
VADTVARHLVAAGQLIDEDPEEAMAHALAARRLASRIAAVREAVGLAAYAAGEWQTAIAELRTYHRMSGKQTHLAVLADCERALGRPERAVDIYRAADKAGLGSAEAIELLIVAAGARGDMGQKDAAVAMLQVRELAGEADEPWAARLRYAYADALLAVGRREEAREWFARASDADVEGTTDAAERLLELDGVVLTGDEKTDLEEDEFPARDGDAGGAEGEAGGDSDEDGEAGYDDEPDAALDDDDDDQDGLDDEDDDGFDDEEDGFGGAPDARGNADEHGDLVDEADEDDEPSEDVAAAESGEPGQDVAADEDDQSGEDRAQRGEDRAQQGEDGAQQGEDRAQRGEDGDQQGEDRQQGEGGPTAQGGEPGDDPADEYGRRGHGGAAAEGGEPGDDEDEQPGEGGEPGEDGADGGPRA